ncbi:hypothetical protein FKP32DRAFT_1106696 [Trametes sanguinea]|nr:hypothetical protein FKP32DRAFT_1106696 [Trametes sanguinea]
MCVAYAPAKFRGQTCTVDPQTPTKRSVGLACSFSTGRTEVRGAYRRRRLGPSVVDETLGARLRGLRECAWRTLGTTSGSLGMLIGRVRLLPVRCNGRCTAGFSSGALIRTRACSRSPEFHCMLDARRLVERNAAALPLFQDRCYSPPQHHPI